MHNVRCSMVLGLSLVVSSSSSLASVRSYTPKRVDAHTATLFSSPYVTATASGDANLVVGYSRGWEPDLIPMHPLYGYAITDPLSVRPKQTVVMISGNHNTEHSGNWVLQGVVDFWISNDPAADLLRTNSELYVYPMVNPDGRLTGIGRANPEMAAEGITDHNRVWDQTGFSNIDILATAMYTDTGGQVDYFFDFHSDQVLSPLQRIEVFDQHVSDTRIIKIDLIHFADFLSQVAAIPGKPKNNESLFQQIDVMAHRLMVHFQRFTKFVQRNGRPRLKSQQLQQLINFIRMSDIR